MPRHTVDTGQPGAVRPAQDAGRQASVRTDLLLCDASVPRLVDLHAERLGLDWRRRARLLASTTHSLDALIAWDERMQAAVDGLRHLDEPGCSRSLEHFDQPITAGDLFAYTVQALVVRDGSLWSACTDLAGTLPTLRDAWLDAVEWAPCAVVQSAISRWTADDPLRLRFALRAWTLAGYEPDTAELARVCSAAPENHDTQRMLLDAARLRARPEWVPHARALLHHPIASVRLAAIRCCLLFGTPGQRSEASAHAATLALDACPEGDIAAQCLAAETGHEGRRLLADLSRQPGLSRRYILALGAQGSPEAVPVLLTGLDTARHARLAAWALTLVTGSDPRCDGWEGPVPPASDTGSNGSDPDARLPWPVRSGFEAWWHRNRERFADGQRYLLGHRRDRAGLVAALQTGPLAARPLAAWAYQRLEPTHAVPERTRGDLQRTLLARYSEPAP